MEIIDIILEIFSDIINEFIFELDNGLLNILLHNINRMSQPRKYGRHRSLVRLIGAGLPLRPCQRTYSQILYSENQCESEALDYFNSGSNGFNAWRKDMKRNSPDGCSSVVSSTPKVGSLERQKHKEISVEKFAALEEQVLQLQADIAKILSSHLLSSADSGATTPSEENDDCFEADMLREGTLPANNIQAPSIPAPPPPPPPPPPPLPSLSLPSQPVREGLTDQINSSSKIQPRNPPPKKIPASTMMPGMDEVLKNIGNVKLRRVERSPGGTPLRRRPLTPPRDDPAALLAAALRRRFAHMRPIELSPDRPLHDSSNPRDFSDLSPKPFDSIDPFSYSLSPQEVDNLGR